MNPRKVIYSSCTTNEAGVTIELVHYYRENRKGNLIKCGEFETGFNSSRDDHIQEMIECGDVQYGDTLMIRNCNGTVFVKVEKAYSHKTETV